MAKDPGSFKPLISLALSLALLGSLTSSSLAYRTRCTPAELELLVRSELAEATNDLPGAVAWAESLAAVAPWSSFAASRVAQIHEQAGEDDRALDWGTRSLALDSLNAGSSMLVGRMLLRSGDAPGAVQVLTPPLRTLGAAPELYALRALAHQLSRNYEGALADLRRTDVLITDFAWVATGVLGLALEDGRLEEASQALQLALELNPSDSRALGLGVTLAQRLGDTFLEETLLRQQALAPDARPEQIAAYGACLAGSGKRREFDMLIRWADARGVTPGDLRLGTAHGLIARRDFRGALGVLKPLGRDDRALPLRARALVALGEEQEALDGYRKLLRVRTISREESLITAYLEIRAGSRDVGLRTLEGIRPGLLESPRQILAGSLCYSLLGYPEEAVALMREGASRGMESPSIYDELASAATETGDSLVAEWAYQRLRSMGQETSECLYFLGASEWAQGKVDLALESLTRSVELNPRNGRALLLLGTLRHRHGQLEMARELLIRASSCPETVGVANRALAEVCRALRLDSEARRAEARARNRPEPRPGRLSLFATP